MSQPLVSVIIPCFNYGRFLIEAIDSVLASTYENIEIIVVNDASTDEYTIELLKDLAKPKTTILHHETNKGLPATRNTGIRASKGIYILPLDADDTIEPTLIEKSVNVLEKKQNIGYVSVGIKIFGLKNKIHYPPKYNFYKLLFSNLSTVTSLFRKEAWDMVGGFNEKMTDGYEDWDFWIAISKNGWYGHRIKEALFNYRKHGKSMISHSKTIHDELVQTIRNNHPELYTEESLNRIQNEWGK